MNLMMNQLFFPRLFHDLDHLWLAINADMALEADHHRPVFVGEGIANSFADISKRHALAECVSVGDDGSVVGWPDVDFDASSAVCQHVLVYCGGRASDQLASEQIGVVGRSS